MARDALRPLENCLVVFNGRLADVTPARNDARDYLLTSVRCWAWDGDSPVPLAARPDATAGHTWLRIAVEDRPDTELLHRVERVATVGWYARSNGSVDLGLRSHRSLNLDEVLLYIRDLRGQASRTEVIKRLDLLIESFASRGQYAFSQHMNASEVKRDLAAYRDRLLRSQVAEERIRATAKPGRRPTGARSFRDLLQAS